MHSSLGLPSLRIAPMNNIERAYNTIQLANEEGFSVSIVIEKDTQILDAIKKILAAGDENNIKIKSPIIMILHQKPYECYHL